MNLTNSQNKVLFLVRRSGLSAHAFSIVYIYIYEYEYWKYHLISAFRVHNSEYDHTSFFISQNIYAPKILAKVVNYYSNIDL